MERKLLGLITGIIIGYSLINFSRAETKVYKINIIKTSQTRTNADKKILYYKIKPGDTLYGILRKYNLPIKMLDEIVKLNKIEDPDKIRVGQTIKIPLPQTKFKSKKTVKVNQSFVPDVSTMLSNFGKIYKEGTILLNSGIVNLKENPLLTIKEKNYIFNLNNNLSPEIIKELESIGYRTVSSKKEFQKLFEDYLLSSFGEFEANGTLKLGTVDKLTYHYDYLTYDTETGNVVIFNLTPDTPKKLQNLLSAYGITLEQPKGYKEEGRTGIFKLLTGKPEIKIAKLITLLTKEKPVKTPYGFTFKKVKIFIASPNINPEEKTRKKMEGFKVITAGEENLENTIKLAVQSIPFVVQKIKLIIVEPPGTEGTRSRFEIRGLSIDTPDKRYFLIPGVEKPEEIPYLISRGINLIIY